MPAPTFSVVIPTYRRPQKLLRCLDALARQTRSPSDFEVIVVDDAGSGGPLERLTARAGPFSFRLLSQERRGAASARNAGAIVARGRLLAFTDDDCEPAPEWLDALARRMGDERDAALVGGRVVNALPEDPFASATQALIEFLGARLNRHPREARLLTSNNLCAPAAAFRDIGGFDTAFTGAGGEDRELCLRWSRAGRPSVYAADAVVHHAHDMTLLGFVRQHYAYGRGAALLRRRALVHGYGPLPFERASFYWDLLASPQRAPRACDRCRQSALFALSQLANAAGYLRVQLRDAT